MTIEDKAFWISWCIEEYSAEYHIPNTETAKIFHDNNILTYLNENGEILHTQGKNYILSTIHEMIMK